MYLVMCISGEKSDLKGVDVHKFHLLKLHGSVTQLVKKSFSFFFRARRFVTMFAKSYQLYWF
jgi:hypothetical protein